jgi:two-component system, NtrC family, sensor kinase
MGVERAEEEVTRQRRREEALEARLRQSEKLAAIGRLAGGVAHELGTPLAVVDGMAQRLERRGEGEAEARGIREAVARMGGIVRELLAFGARESGERQRVNAGVVLAGAVAAVGEEAQARGVAVEVVELPSRLEIEADRVRLEGALVHLLRNAVQAAGAGSGAGGTVRARVLEEEGAVTFVVEDDGAGVPEEVRDRLFEPFFTTKPVGEGSGLGLAVVHSVAEEHGGRVVLGESSLGGARFALVLTREVDHE